MTAAPLEIRPAGPDDVPAMARVFADAIEAKARDSYGPRERAAWAARGSAERFRAMLDDERNQLLVAVQGSRITGLAGLTGCDVSLLYTSPDAEAGTGTRLLAVVEDLARTQGIGGLGLTASRNAVAFYLRRGYAVARLAVRPLPGGLALPVCLMVKALQPAQPTRNGTVHGREA
ncbi:MAG: GNAT family N-acetyltransferase [Solidesulfovibrio sp. DCME]|uniref:GNAT family N-acetyltransferase n=1 Tax=Solidesulfovibrio sp. DCME TaxID=3447380 RepID=UPI003D0E059D